MIIWLASYPRSGNTLLRLMLNQVFGCKTCGKRKHYRRPAPGERPTGLNELTGAIPLEGAWPEVYVQMTASDELFLVKTHESPDDDAKAVYIARNGFATLTSYHHYLRDLQQKSFSLEDIILGKPRFGSWGYHLDVWQPFERPNTLLLTYEDLMQKPEEQIEKLSEFCGLRQQNAWVNEFDKLHALNPGFFRKAEMGDASAEFSEAERALFWSLHGDWMRRLGYAKHCDRGGALPHLRRALMNYTRESPAEPA